MTVRPQFAALLLLGMAPWVACAQTPAEPPAVQLAETPAPAAQVSALRVEYDGNKLTVTAKRVKLGELLAAITEKTGMVFSLPDSLANLEVSAEAGPAGVREALTGLLKKSPVDYAMAGAADEPDKLERVVILARSEKASVESATAEATEAGEAVGNAADGTLPDAYQAEDRLIREARETAEAARKAEEQKPAEAKSIEPTETGEPRNYQSGLSETEATMTPEELYRYWMRSREEQQRKLKEAQGSAPPH